MNDNKIEAEAYVGGVLRGGYLIGELFCYHACGTYIKTKDFSELNILEDIDTHPSDYWRIKK